MFHRFPADKSLCQVWKSLCRRGDDFNISNARICSKHFAPEDYRRDLKQELLQISTKSVLKSEAVPSLYLPDCEDTRKENDDRKGSSDMQ